MDERLADWEVVVLGCGQMGSALARGAVDARALDGAQLYCVDVDRSRAEALAQRTGGEVGWPPDDREEIPAMLVILAVKPQHMAAALDEHRDRFGDEDCLLSLAAGLPIGQLRDWVGGAPQLVRAMPNTPALVRAGVTGVCAESFEEEIEPVIALLEAVGEVIELGDESDFDALTAISGSGPAYVFVMIEALADAGVRQGLSRQIAQQLAVQTIAGAARLASSPQAHPAQLKDQVTSPAGTTIEAIAKLEELGFRHALIEAVAAACGRSKEMGRQLASDDEDQDHGGER